ncbi:hypothetical protein D8Y22_18965 [Salinadaptatus halalkaliphilus]|uniref:HTH iclR-type domain-containing protein n=1 Tax=Salinadaptatus halalkaliphilus TaxID=2419781 RepID=A0A4S3THI7_9EURY|nr:hypothetical protein [Salinadaptatus halalkaliphilus]THE63376.1 hypothetical protein D8Y22_18965 [Salinadaptatus halalkaliphilus]
MHRPVSVGLVVFVVVAAGLVGPIGATGLASASTTQSPPTDTTTAVASVPADDVGSGDFDTTTFEITVHENGSATWTFRHEQRLDGDDEADNQANFEAFAEEFEAEETGLYERFTDQAQALTEGNDAVDREMAASNFNRSAGIDGQINPIGVVEMSFLWEGFGATDGDAIVVGDVFQTIYITDDQSLVIEPDGDLEFRTADPEPDYYVGSSLQQSGLIQWSGEREFFDGHPRVVLEPADDAGGSSTPFTGTAGGGENGLSWSLLIPVALATVGVVVGAFWYYRRSNKGDSPPAEPGSGPDTRTAAGSQPARQDDDQSTGVTDDDLLTDEDRVVKLIEANGGRMKQVNIVDETGWSKSKVSMLLSEMEDDGTISKLRVGRENIISLEGFEPEATKSPFEE